MFEKITSNLASRQTIINRQTGLTQAGQVIRIVFVVSLMTLTVGDATAVRAAGALHVTLSPLSCTQTLRCNTASTQSDVKVKRESSVWTISAS